MKARIIELIEGKIGIEGVQVERNEDLTFGDFKTNIAMIQAKKQNRKPLEVAQEIIEKIDKEMFEKVEIAGPGFINFYLKKDFVARKLQAIGTGPFYENLLTYGNNKTMVIDYSAPNIAKPFGIGHLRSTNIGQAIYNLYKILGWKTIGDNHIGDWGTQFGKLIVAIKAGWIGKPVDQLTIDELEKLYVEFHTRAQSDESLNDAGREWFSKLESGDKEARDIWQKCIDVSTREHNKVYELLDVKIDYVHGESFYEDLMPKVIEECKTRGIAKVGEGGAWIVEFNDMPPAMLLKSNGTTTYFTRDLATILYRKETWKPDLAIYEVGADQTLHLRQVFAAASLLGWGPKEGLVHVAHGLIRWKDGKFSTRRGDTIHLSDVVDKALAEAKKTAEGAHVQKHTTEERDSVIKAIGIGAVKFADLLSEPKKDIIFDWDRIMSVDGDSGPYVQYTYARCKSLLEKAETKPAESVDSDLTKSEEKLLHLLFALEEKIIDAAERYSPSIICTYVLQVARTFNEFYGTTQILGVPQTESRLFLVEHTAEVIRNCLNLLGIKVVERL